MLIYLTCFFEGAAGAHRSRRSLEGVTICCALLISNAGFYSSRRSLKGGRVTISKLCNCEVEAEVEAEVEDEVEAEVEAEAEDRICSISCHPPLFKLHPPIFKLHPPTQSWCD